MKMTISKCRVFLSLFLFFTFLNCTVNKSNENRVYFEIDPYDRKVLIPAQLDDTITANLVFDTGGKFALDSTFASLYSSLIPDAIPVASQSGSAWQYSSITRLTYKTPYCIRIGEETVEYDYVSILEQKKHFGNEVFDGMFNIPLNDTTHVWELNFEHNYLEIHKAEDFVIPKESFFMKMVDNAFRIRLPLTIGYDQRDTLQLNHIYTIDTGAPWDVVLMRPTQQESEFLKDRENIVWTRSNQGYYLYQTVAATLFDSFPVDSLRIYTMDDSPRRVNSRYLIGLNFLKRFNVFFDMRNQQVALQSIKNFKRVVNPGRQRFFFSVPLNNEGKYIVTKVADYEKNYFKKAGLKVGDEIVKSEGFFTDTVVMKIIRDNKPMELVVPVEKDYVWGE